MIAFRVNCIPPRVSHHHKKIVRVPIGKGRTITKLSDKPELVAAKQSLDAWFLPYQPRAPLTGPVSLDIEMTWPWLSDDRKRDRAKGRIPHAQKPDADNAAKTITDCLVRLCFLEQDSRIVDLRVRKWRGDSPGIAITIAPAQVPATQETAR